MLLRTIEFPRHALGRMTPYQRITLNQAGFSQQGVGPPVLVMFSPGLRRLFTVWLVNFVLTQQ